MDLGRDDAITLLAYSMAASDGITTVGEEEAIHARLRERGIRLDGLRREALRRAANDAYDEASALLERVAAALPDELQRIDAMRLAIEVVWADASIAASEVAQVMEVADALGLGRGTAGRLLQERT